jgi:Zn-dependent protease
MRFRLFGIPTEVQLGFWFMAVLLGLDRLQSAIPASILVWVAVVFVSVMVHELGHAVAIMRHGHRPEITLHMLGGLTSWGGAQGIGRLDRIVISFAGPAAGFVLGGLVWGVTAIFPDLVRFGEPGELGQAQALGRALLDDLRWVNVVWGVINLIPVLPLDGGHILEQALGPQRVRTTAVVSLLVGGSVALYFFAERDWWIGFIFAMSALQSFQRFQASTAPQPVDRTRPPSTPPAEPVPPETAHQLERARRALTDDRYEEAGTLAELVLARSPPLGARLEALDLLAWAALLDGRPKEAARVIGAIERDGTPDPALIGSVLHALGERGRARSVFEAARAAGDDRKEIVGPLIQILISEGEVSRAAAIALDIVDSLSDEDARRMADIALEHECYPWVSRLREAVFERTGDPIDAYEAARGRALEGDPAASLGLLRRAVAAGFSDAARLWSDQALAALCAKDDARGELESLLPKP